MSHQWFCTCDAPLPFGGSRWPQFPAFSGTIRALRLPAPLVLRLIGSPAGSVWLPAHSCPPSRSRCPAGTTPGRDLDCSRWPSPSSDLAHGQEQDLPGFLAPHPATLRRSTTPDDPWRLAVGGAAGAAPRMTTLKASSLQLSRLKATLHRPLSTLHDARCRSPCKTRFRLAGCAFAGRESNPLGRVERFQIKSSSFPGLGLAQGHYSTPIDKPGAHSHPFRPRGRRRHCSHVCPCRGRRFRLASGTSATPCGRLPFWSAGATVDRSGTAGIPAFRRDLRPFWGRLPLWSAGVAGSTRGGAAGSPAAHLKRTSLSEPLSVVLPGGGDHVRVADPGA